MFWRIVISYCVCVCVCVTFYSIYLAVEWCPIYESFLFRDCIEAIPAKFSNVCFIFILIFLINASCLFCSYYIPFVCSWLLCYTDTSIDSGVCVTSSTSYISNRSKWVKLVFALWFMCIFRVLFPMFWSCALSLSLSCSHAPLVRLFILHILL